MRIIIFSQSAAILAPRIARTRPRPPLRRSTPTFCVTIASVVWDEEELFVVGVDPTSVVKVDPASVAFILVVT